MSRETLNKDRIVRAAVKLMNQQGLEKLSMRKLGSELGVEAMSLYNHVRNKSDLLDGVHEHLLGSLELPEEGNDTWQESVRIIARRFRDLLKNHPGALRLFSSRSAKAPGSLRVLDRCVGVFLSAGVPPQSAIYLFQIIYTYVLGHAQYYFGPRTEDSYSDPSSYLELANLSQLPPMANLDPEREFSTALEILIKGLEEKI